MGAPKTPWKASAPTARKNFWSLIQENSLVFLLNNALVYMFPSIQNKTLKKERIWVRIRGTFLVKKGAPNLNFHREGGNCPHLPPKSAIVQGTSPPFSKSGGAIAPSCPPYGHATETVDHFDDV